MSVVAIKRKVEKRGARGVAALHRVTTRGAAYAKAQVGNHLGMALALAALAVCALVLLAA